MLQPASWKTEKEVYLKPKPAGKSKQKGVKLTQKNLESEKIYEQLTPFSYLILDLHIFARTIAKSWEVNIQHV